MWVPITADEESKDEIESLEKGKELLERELLIQEKHYGKDHYEVAKILNNLANAYKALGNVDKAKELLKRAYTIAVNHPNCGVSHSLAKTVKNNLEALETEKQSAPVLSSGPMGLFSKSAENNKVPMQ